MQIVFKKIELTKSQIKVKPVTNFMPQNNVLCLHLLIQANMFYLCVDQTSDWQIKVSYYIVMVSYGALSGPEFLVNSTTAPPQT